MVSSQGFDDSSSHSGSGSSTIGDSAESNHGRDDVDGAPHLMENSQQPADHSQQPSAHSQRPGAEETTNGNGAAPPDVEKSSASPEVASEVSRQDPPEVHAFKYLVVS